MNTFPVSPVSVTAVSLGTTSPSVLRRLWAAVCWVDYHLVVRPYLAVWSWWWDRQETRRRRAELARWLSVSQSLSLTKGAR